jgi:integrase
MDIHNFASRLEHIKSKIKTDNKISDHNKALILKFSQYCEANGLKAPSITKDLYSVWFLAHGFNKNFEDVTRGDAEALVSKVEAKADWTGWTKRNHRIALRKFVKWVKGIDEPREYPKEVKWIKTGLRELKNKLPEELLTEEEILRMSGLIEDPRDKAFILTLYETGARIGEILGLQIKHITFEKDITYIMLNGKTGMRKIPVMACAPALADWINLHPMKEDREAFLWVTKFNRIEGVKELPKEEQTKKRKSEAIFIPLTYQGARKILQKWVKKAGIKKRVYPHLLRHTSATISARFLTEAQMKEYYGWSRTSTMPGIYVHLSQRDILQGVLKKFGKLQKEEETVNVKSSECPRCRHTNSPGSKFCSYCGNILDIEITRKLQAERMKSEAFLRDKKIDKTEFFKWLEEKFYPMYLKEAKK